MKPEQMKIIYLHQYFNTPSMPGGTRSYEMARRLVKMGHQVEMVTSWRENDERNDWFVTEEAGIKVHWLPVAYSNKMGFKDRVMAFNKFALGAAKKAIELEGDVVFATSTPLTIAIPGIIASKIKRIPMVFEVRDLWPELPIAIGALNNPILKLAAKILEKIAYFNAKRIVALSPGMLEGVVKTGYPHSRVSMIPNSSDIELFKADRNKAQEFRHKFEWLQNRPLIIYCGTMGQINGVEYLAKVAKSMLDINREVRFLVIGHGKMESFVKNEAEKLGVLNNNFFMKDQIPKQRMPEVFAAANISTSTFIDLPEMWANSANKFFDTLASGTPAMINYHGWQSELLKETGAGFVVDVNSPESAAQEINKRINDADWLKKAGKAALKLAKTRFSRDLLAQKLEKVLLQAIEK
jgi:glycosyltransferase involved in cell wall biosynthesis